jgi:hypothetical protein
MRWPRKGILIRLAIYGPLVAFLSYNACANWRARQDANELAEPPGLTTQSLEEKLAPHKRTVTLPDGTKQDVYELTPEEAERLLGAPVAPPEDAD